jgi:hypothetical protein
MEMVVVPRSAELEESDAALRFALVALVAGTRPAISTTMVTAYLNTFFGLDTLTFSVSSTRSRGLRRRFRSPARP